MAYDETKLVDLGDLKDAVTRVNQEVNKKLGAFNVASAPSLVRELTIITGVGFDFIILSRAVIPSIVGISISIVITSGLNCSAISMASWPFFAIPTISISGSPDNRVSNAFLINIESSTIKTLILFIDIL